VRLRFTGIHSVRHFRSVSNLERTIFKTGTLGSSAFRLPPSAFRLSRRWRAMVIVRYYAWSTEGAGCAMAMQSRWFERANERRLSGKNRF
jgi:hypothetical protein